MNTISRNDFDDGIAAIKKPYALRAVVYSRVSTDAQENKGTSLDSQERASQEFVADRGWTLIESIRDTASGASLDRLGIEQLRLLLRQGSVDVVVAYDVDRLSRNQNHIGVLFDEVEQAGAQLQFVTENFEDTAIGRFILSARAFIGEVEREKIAERTMRGKAEKARSGRLPQGTGLGCYGYIYDKGTKTRTVNITQAAVVNGIFTDFISGVSIVNIINRLNDAKVLTFTGSTWYPATIHHMLRNETYTGRTTYRKTSVKMVRDPKTGRKRKQVNEQDPSKWIVIEGASPPIVDRQVFDAAQTLLDDPERRRRASRIHDYPLSGRMKCLRCQRAMVGQTLKGKYQNYRCRRAFAGPKIDRCPTLYVRGDALERAIKEEAALVLANPELILSEAEKFCNQRGNDGKLAALKAQLTVIETRRGRLLKLYEMSEIEDEYFHEESKTLRAEKAQVEEQIHRELPPVSLPTIIDLELACEKIREWVLGAEGDELTLLLNALQIKVGAERCKGEKTGRGELRGVIPEYTPRNSDADVCSMVINFSSN